MENRLVSFTVSLIQANLEDCFPDILAIAKNLLDDITGLRNLAELVLPKMAINVNNETKKAFVVAVRNIVERVK